MKHEITKISFNRVELNLETLTYGTITITCQYNNGIGTWI